MNFEIIKGDTADGFAQSIQEVDDALREQIPKMNRKTHREEVRQEIDNLLDQRNEIIAIASCFAIEQEQL